MENLYSTIFIVDISQNPDEVDTVTSRIQQLIEDHGGIIKKIDRWGKRRLAYPIKKKNYGFYVEIEFSANSHLNIAQTLENEYKLNDRVLRYLTYVIDKKELIQRAKNAAKAGEEAKPTAPAEEKPAKVAAPEAKAETAEKSEKPVEETPTEKAPVENPPVEETVENNETANEKNEEKEKNEE